MWFACCWGLDVLVDAGSFDLHSCVCQNVLYGLEVPQQRLTTGVYDSVFQGLSGGLVSGAGAVLGYHLSHISLFDEDVGKCSLVQAAEV